MLRRTFPLVLVLFLTAACSLLEGPQQPVIPTPVPTAPPLDLGAEATGELVFDPVSDVTPAVDPEIESLVNAVSQQQLVGYVQTLAGFETRNTFSTTDSQEVGIGAARLWIFNELVRVGGGRLQVQFDDFPLNYNGAVTEQQNIIATLPGSGAHPGVIVLAAHYDSRTVNLDDGESSAPGADDNASGVAVLIEVARLLSSRTWNQTVVFISFAAEEQGRYGSRHFVPDRLLQGWMIDAAIVNDIVGGRPGIPQSIRVFSPGPDTSTARQLARYLNYVGGLYLPTFPVTLVDAIDRTGRYSDHITFLDAGIPALRLTESEEDVNRQHNALDTSDAIDYNYLVQVTQLSLVTVVNAIGAPAVPPAPTVAPMADPGGFILTWAPDPQAAGYVISFRPLGSAAYAPFRFVSGAQAGNVALTGFDPATEYAVSLAALDGNGRIGLFSPEIIVSPSP